MTLREANAFIKSHHRHVPGVRGWRFGVGLEVNGKLVGVGVAGRPVARELDDGRTLEVNRVCVLEGQPNANSRIYGALGRAAAALGYRRLITYTMVTESGASVRAAGFTEDGRVRGRSWHTQSRPREDKHVIVDRVRWVRCL